MKGIILAGGTGSRLEPLTRTINKHLLPVGGVPMVYWPLVTLKSLGITEILIVTGGNNIGNFLHQLGDGSEFGVELTFRIQTSANGIAGALDTAKKFVGDNYSAVILGDNVFVPNEASNKNNLVVRKLFQSAQESNSAAIVVSEVEDPERFGVLDIKNNVMSIVEKPLVAPSNHAVTGLYLYPPDVFSVIKMLHPSNRGELEITDVNNFYCKEGRCKFTPYLGFWHDAGTHESMRGCNNYIYDNNLNVSL